MRILDLFEDFTADDIFRKIDGLDAMISDPSTTSGEKANAAAAKQRLQDRLEKQFPGAVKSSAKTSQSFAWNPGEYEFWSNLARGAATAQELEDLKKNDPTTYKERMREKLNAMKKRLATLRRRHVPGNVETAEEIRQRSRELDSFIRREFPDLWQAEEAKREKAREKSYARQDKLRAEKLKTGREKVKKSGLSNWSELGKQLDSALRTMFNALKGTKTQWGGRLGEEYYSWKGGPEFLRILPYLPMGAIRKVWNSNIIDETTKSQLTAAVNNINTQGVKFKGYTSAQKKSLLSAMTAYKDPKKAQR